jgi:dolichol-phosphate mannosyltransferase
MNIVIVIPTYNEKDNIKPLVEKIFKVVPEIKILIVDDNSPDGTGRIADELNQRYKQVKVLHREKKEGLGKAYIAGFKEALKMNPDYILQMDADFSHHPKYIPEFLKEITNCDIVVGSRFLNREEQPVNVTAFSLWANRYVKWVLGLKITDCLGGFKCFQRKVIEGIDLDKFISKGFIFQTEFLYRALKKGFVIHEIPIIFYSRNSGLSKKSKRIILEALFKTILFRLF